MKNINTRDNSTVFSGKSRGEARLSAGISSRLKVQELVKRHGAKAVGSSSKSDGSAGVFTLSRVTDDLQAIVDAYNDDAGDPHFEGRIIDGCGA
jgi:hypothetical protein